MDNYYFTFGQNHWHKDGIPMFNSWVRVVAESHEKARELFVEQFTIPFMDAPDKFAFQYSEKEWEPEWFPQGEFTVINQTNP